MAEFLTTRQLQEILHVDRTTIYRMADDGRIPALKVGNQWRFPRQSIEGWLKIQSGVAVASDEEPVTEDSSELSKLLPVECVQRIQDTFADMLGAMMVLTDLEGRPVTEVSHPSGLYRLVSTRANARSQCRQEWANLASQPSLQPILVQGHLGLLYARALVRVGAELKAMLVVGGFAPEQWPPDNAQVEQMAEQLGVDTPVLQRRIQDVFVLSPGEQQEVLDYIQRIADIIAHIITERNMLFAKLHHIAELTKI